MKRLLKGGRVVDPVNGIDGVYDVLIEGDRIARVGRDLPADIRRFGVSATSNVEEAIRDADVIMLLRIQLERMEGAYFPSLREYFNVFGMTEARLRLASPEVMIMHPGPMNRGVEIASEVADGPYSVILDQVANGVAVRMAVLYLLAGGTEHDEAA